MFVNETPPGTGWGSRVSGTGGVCRKPLAKETKLTAMKMDAREDGGSGDGVGNINSPPRHARGMAGLFLLLVCALGVAATFILFEDREAWVLLVALAVGAALWALERRGTWHTPGGPARWRVFQGCLLPALVIALAAFAVCLPNINSYFVDDDFAYLHHFHIVSLAQFLRLYHTDIAQLLWHDPRQELRPLYGLYYMVSYQFWGIHPLGYRVVATSIHVLNSLLVYWIAKDTVPDESPRAGFAALLFAVSQLNSEVFFWATGAPSELLPVFFYLAAFVCFMRFRATGAVRYLVAALAGFALGLSGKESAITLPVMLAAYEIFRQAKAEKTVAPATTWPRRKLLWRLTLFGAPFAVLLLGYLKLRHIASGDYLRVSYWGLRAIRADTASLAIFWYHFQRLLGHVWDFQSFNLRQLLLPYDAPFLGIVLGLYLAWACFLLGRRSECIPTIGPIVYFGLVWYLISTVPLVVPGLGIGHLYLPSVGPCIATSFLAFPVCDGRRKEPVYLRLLGAGILVILSGAQLWKQNNEWALRAQCSTALAADLRSAVQVLPQHTLIIMPPSEDVRAVLDGALPYLLQEPFEPVDLYSRARIIEDPIIYCCPWWEKTRLTLAAELAGPPDEQIEVFLLGWDEQHQSVQQRRRALPRRALQECVTKTIGKPLASADSLDFAGANKLVETLARLVLDGH